MTPKGNKLYLDLVCPQQVCYFEADVIAENTKARCFVLFGSAGADASFFSGRSWLAKEEETPRPRLHARPCSLLPIPTITTNTTCGILCWDTSVTCKLAYWLRYILVK